MGMLIVNDDVFEEEHSKSQLQKEIPNNVVRRPFHGRKPGDTNIPESLRKLVIEDNDLGKELGISQSSISAYSHGAVSTASYHQMNPALKETVDARDLKIGNIAKGKILRALKHITDDKLANSKPLELSTVARNLATVAGLNTDKEVSQVNNNIVFYAPTPVKNDSMPVIEVSSIRNK